MDFRSYEAFSHSRRTSSELQRGSLGLMFGVGSKVVSVAEKVDGLLEPDDGTAETNGIEGLGLSSRFVWQLPRHTRKNKN